MESLESSPRRQAVATLKGYSYQIWQSLFRWFDLGPNQELFLEGAEDIDLLGPGEAETIQVKAISKPITLRSNDVIESINNFWEHKQANAKTDITFRLLTTASRATENTNLFGGEKGLDVWDRAKTPGVDSSALCEFLLSLDTLSPELKTFLRNATQEDLRAELLVRLEWDTGQEEHEFLEEIVDRKVIEFGERVFDLPPSDSKKVTPHLLMHVWKVVRQADERILRRSDLATIFENNTMELVPRSKLRSIAQFDLSQTRYSPSRQQTSDEDAFSPVTGAGILEAFSAPDPSRFIARTELVIKGKESINKTGILVLTGMTGMGKSILSNQIIGELEGDWRKVDFRGVFAQDIATRLDWISRFLADNPRPINLLFDDLNFDQGVTLYEAKLAKVLYLCRMRQSRLVVTSQNDLPVAVVGRCGVSDHSYLKAPLLELTEIEELAQIYGAPNIGLDRWANLIAIQTGRHPQLVHAQITALQFRDWKRPEKNELFESPRVNDVRKEFRKILQEMLPEDARTFLYRLSVFINRFTRGQAIEIGEREPPVKMAGEIFDKLIGPWIEPDGSKHYRLSPLLSDAARNVFSEKDFKDLHSAAASSYLTLNSIDPQDINSILMHGLGGNNPFPMIVLVPKLFGIETEHKDAIYELLSWFPLVNLEGAKTFFKGFKLANAMLRQLQFTIQAHLHPDKVSAIVASWDRELREKDGIADIPGTGRQLRFTFLSDILIYTNARLKPELVVGYLIELNAMLRSDEPFFPDHPEEESQYRNAFRGLDDIKIYLGASVARSKSGTDMLEFLSALSDAEPDETEEIWEIFDADSELSTLAVDRIWLTEANNEKPDWSACLQKLDAIIQISNKEKATALLAASYRSKAIVYEEYLKDPDAALRELSEGKIAAGGSHILLDEYESRILLFRERYEEALVVLRRIIQTTNDNPPGKYVVFRDAEMCAGHLGLWNEAGKHALGGMASALRSGPNASAAQEESTLIFATTFEADYAYCLWKDGKRQESVQQLAIILGKFDQILSFKEDVRALMLYRRVGYLIGWLLKGETITPEAPFEPSPGWFSDFSLHDEVKSFPIPPTNSLWLLLAQLQYQMELGTSVLDEIARRTLSNEERAMVSLLTYKAHLVNADNSQLPLALISLFESSREFPGAGNGGDSDFLIETAMPLLLKLPVNEDGVRSTLSSWKDELGKHDILTERVEEWIDQVEETFLKDAFGMRKTLTDPLESAQKRRLAAIALSKVKDLDPEVRFYANSIFVTDRSWLLWSNEIGSKIEEMVVTAWKDISNNQRFALVTPQSTVPKILKSCEDPSHKGFGKAAKVLLTATEAIRLRVDESIIADLRSLL